MLAHRDSLEVVNVTPLDKDAVLVAHDSLVRIVDIHGQATRVRSMKTNAPLKFSFRIENIGQSAYFSHYFFSSFAHCNLFPYSFLFFFLVLVRPVMAFRFSDSGIV